MVCRTQDRRLDWFRLDEAVYVPLTPDAAGVIHSKVFSGLWPAVDKLLSGDLAVVLLELQKGLQTVGHVTLIAQLTGEQ